MKQYEAPEMEVILFGTANVVTESMLERDPDKVEEGGDW